MLITATQPQLTSQCARRPSLGAGCASRRYACPRPARQPKPCRSAAHAQATATHNDDLDETIERVLRYPNGEERRIRYPVHAAGAAAAAHAAVPPAAGLVERSYDDGECSGWDITGYSSVAYHDVSLDSASQHVQATRTSDFRRGASHGSSPSSTSTGASSTSSDAASTAAYLESLFAQAYTDTEPETPVEETYEVLSGCPWPIPRQVYVLAQQDSPAGLETGGTYTLRVRMEQQGASSDLARLLGKPALEGALSCSRMVDGMLMFRSEDEAHCFAAMLAEEGHDKVVVAEVDSHKAFRMVDDVKAVVVLMAAARQPPRPFQLAAALKKQRAWDEL